MEKVIEGSFAAARASALRFGWAGSGFRFAGSGSGPGRFGLRFRLGCRFTGFLSFGFSGAAGSSTGGFPWADQRVRRFRCRRLRRDFRHLGGSGSSISSVNGASMPRPTSGPVNDTFRAGSQSDMWHDGTDWHTR
jgi:hypothetical protein